MKRRIRITSIRREPIDTTLLAQVLIELVMYKRDQERLKAQLTQQAKMDSQDDHHEPT
jgi:hypothetical protein